jgi:beta-N-acetylhexosaminidase
VAEARSALSAAVRAGRLPEDRLASAAARVGTLGEAMRVRRTGPDTAAGEGADRARGRDRPGGEPGALDGLDRDAAVAGDRAAEAALRCAGRLPDLRHALVVRVVDRPTVAAGPVAWDLAVPLADLVPGVTGLDLVPGGGPARALAAAAGRPLVVLARDLDRSPGARRAVTALLATRPDAVLVDAGWPSADLPPAAGVVRTHGSSRPSLRAAARLLARVGR